MGGNIFEKYTLFAGTRQINRPAFSEGLAMAQLADMADQRTNGIVVESVTPSGHARRAAHGQSAQLDGVEQLFVAACFQIIGFGVVARRHRQKPGIDAIPLARQSMALGAVKLVGVARLLSDRLSRDRWIYRFRLR